MTRAAQTMQIRKKPTSRWFALTLLGPAVLAVAAGRLPARVDQPQTEPIEQRINRLIEQLGDDDYFIRERAQAELSKFSYEAFDALSAATNHEDLEIATRARYLLRMMKVDWTAENDPEAVKSILKDYEAQNMPGKLDRMRSLAALPEGMGIRALCRLVRYEKSSLLSKHAAMQLLDRRPSADPPEKELAEKLRKNLNGSRRTAAKWLLTWLRFGDQPQAVITDWEKLVEAEHSLLRTSPNQTSSGIVAKLVRFQIEWLEKLKQKAQAVAAMRRLIDLEKGNPDTLAELLDWLIEQKAWEVADELAAKFAAQFAGNPLLLYTLAQAQAEAGEQQRAEQTAERARKLNPGNGSTQLASHYSTARTLLARGLPKWAQQEYRHVLETGAPGNAVVVAAMTEWLDWLVEQGAWKEVDELADQLAPRFAENAILLYTRAQSQAAQGHPRRAEQTAAEALKLNAGKDRSQLYKHRTAARVLQNRRLLNWAAREYRHVVDQGDNDSETLVELLDCLVALKAWKDVDELAGRFPLRFTGNAILLYSHAQAQAEAGEQQRAEQTAQRAQKLNPGNGRELLDKHRRVARTLQQRGLFRWAQREYRHVIDSGTPGDIVVVFAQYALAATLHDQGEDLEAAKVLEVLADALRQHPNPETLTRIKAAETRSRMHFFLACHFESKGAPAKRREHLDKAIEADPTDLDVLIACYRLPGQTPEYRERIRRLVISETAALRKRIAEEPTSATACNQFAWLVGNTEGDFDEALRYSKRSTRLRPHFSGYYDTLAHVYFAKGDYENAVKTQAKAAELEPHSGLIARQLEVFRKKWEAEKKQL